MECIHHLIIAHSHPHFLLILQNIIRSCQGIRIIGKVTNFTDLLHAAATLKPDIIIADIALPGMKGFTALQQLATGPHPAKLILSWRYIDKPVLTEAIEAQCAGYIILDAPPLDYLFALRQVIKGKVFYCIQTEKLRNQQKNADGAIIPEEKLLTEKYFLMAYCLWLGYTNKEIAIALELTKDTVETYRKVLRKMIGSGSIAALENFIIRNKIM
jgi:DNA-binding NarL/FixJ family response regulator